MPIFPLVAQLGRFISAGRTTNYSQFIRGISTVRQIAVPPFEHAIFTRVDQVCDQLDRRLRESLASSVSRVSQFNRMTIVSFPEFALCGEYDAGARAWIYPGKNTIPIEWRDAIANQLSKTTQDLTAQYNEPILTIFSTTYHYDEDVKDEAGRSIATNTAIATTGPDNTLLVDKCEQTEADGMGEGKVIVSSNAGFKAIEVRDIPGAGDGKSVIVGVKTCVEASIGRPFELQDAIRSPDVVAIVSRGAPSQPFADRMSKLFVNDSTDHHRSTLMRGITGALEPEKEVEGFGQLPGGGLIARTFTTILDYLNISPSAFAANSHRLVGGNQTHEVKNSNYSYKVLESATVSIPTTINEQDLGKSNQQMMDNKSIMLDPDARADDPGRTDPQVAHMGDPPGPVEPEGEGPERRQMRLGGTDDGTPAVKLDESLIDVAPFPIPITSDPPYWGGPPGDGVDDHILMVARTNHIDITLTTNGVQVSEVPQGRPDELFAWYCLYFTVTAAPIADMNQPQDIDEPGGDVLDPGYTITDLGDTKFHVNRYSIEISPVTNAAPTPDQTTSYKEVPKPENVLPVDQASVPWYSPQTTELSTTYSSSLSKSFSGNIGFFGKTGTAGFGGSISVENGEQKTVPAVTVVNNTHLATASFEFQLADGAAVGTSAYEFYAHHFHHIADPGKGLRSVAAQDAMTAAVVIFQITIRVWGTYTKSLSWPDGMGGTPLTDSFDCNFSGQHVHLLAMRAPPLPPQPALRLAHR